VQVARLDPVRAGRQPTLYVQAQRHRADFRKRLDLKVNLLIFTI
jgi:hypothetical protein